MRRAFVLPILLAAGSAACMVGPDYHRPKVEVPATFRDAPPPVPIPAPVMGDLAWWDLFADPVLHALIRTALEANYDLRITVTRILQAQAQVTIARSQIYPTVNAGVEGPYTRYTGGSKPPLTPKETFAPDGGVSISWELDLWGRLRRATEAARAELLASEETRRAVVTTLIAQVSQTYFDLRSLDASLEISRRTLTSRQQSLALTRARLEGGVTQLLDVRQSEAMVADAAKTIPEFERQITQTENAMDTLLGRDPAPIPRGLPLLQQITLPAVPPGVPSELLARRPDIRQAEQQLIAANAQIGAAKALLFPTVTITGFAGAGGAVVSGQSFGPYGLFTALPTITLPLFNMGRLQAGVEQAEALTQEAVLRYQQTIQQAVREVADALVEVRKRQEARREQDKLVAALADGSRVADMRYRGGVSSYLEVLDTDTRLFNAELQLAQAQLDELAAVIQLYKALGGGWQTEEAAQTPQS
jgi:outer membrane protein, multidrug efflux system